MDHGAEESDAEKAKELLKRFNVTVFFIDMDVMVSISFLIPISHVLFCLCVYVCFFFFFGCSFLIGTIIKGEAQS